MHELFYDVDGDTAEVTTDPDYVVLCSTQGAVGSADLWLTPETARSLAKALKRAAKEVEERNA